MICLYPWAVIPLEYRNDHLWTLDRVSIDVDIERFAELISKKVRSSMKQAGITSRTL